MANVLDIKRRIRSVRNTRQITKAMQMVSAAKLRRAQERAFSARPYAQRLTSVLKSLVSRADIYNPVTGEPLHPLLMKREEKTILLVVVAGEKGLAGAFSTNVLKEASKFIESRKSRNIDLVCVGKKARDFYRRRYPMNIDGTERKGQIQITGENVGILNRVKYADVQVIAESLVEHYAKEEVDSVFIVFNEFKSVIAQRLVAEQILPVVTIGVQEIEMADTMSAEERHRALEAAKATGAGMASVDTRAVDQQAALFGAAGVDYIYEQSAADMFSGLLPKYVAIQVFRATLESEAAEHAARMTAMESATNYATDMIDSLTLVMNRARQAKITKEIIEIVSGAAAQ